MSEQVQELINKIKQEGIEEAQKKAKEIEDQARAKANQIVENAKKEAQKITHDAQEETKKMRLAAEMAIKQSSRNTILSLRKEIENILKKIITRQVSETLTSEQLGVIIQELIKKSAGTESKAEVQVNLNPKDLDKLKNGFFTKLQNEVKQPIQFQSAQDIAKGFTISFDGGKSRFDFTDISLAEYLSTYLNPQVAALVKESIA